MGCGLHEGGDALRRVIPVDGDRGAADRFDPAGEGEGDRGERGAGRRPSERPVIDADHPEMGSLEGPAQGYQRPGLRCEPMAAGPSLLRCPACGGFFRASPPTSGPVPWVPCPHCRRPVALVGARDPPPLFRWEVVPNLYPVPRLPRRARDPRRGIAVVLLMAALLGASIAGALLVEGYEATVPLQVTVSGTVLKETPRGNLPASGGRIVLTDDSGTQRSVTLGSGGQFVFDGVRAGGIELNATLPGYAPQVLVTFVSTIYSASPTTDLLILLVPGGPANTSTTLLAPFPNLTTLVATFGATAILLIASAAVAAVAARSTYQDGRRPLGIAGGAAVVLVPVAILLTGVAQVLPLLWLASGPLAGLGAYVLAIRLSESLRFGGLPGV